MLQMGENGCIVLSTDDAEESACVRTVCGPQKTDARGQQSHEEQQLRLRRQQNHLAHDQRCGDRRQTVAEHAHRLEE